MATTISSTFDLDRDNWTVSGDAQGSSVIPNYVSTGGVSGGYVSAVDDVTGGTWYWKAPSKFLGNLSSSYGLKLSFNLKQSDVSSPFTDSDVILQGNGVKLTYQLPNHPGTNWTAYEVSLSEPGWINASTGKSATQSDLKSALGSVSGLYIRGEYRYGSDTGGLDSIVLQTSPENQSEIYGTENNDVLSGTQADEIYWGLGGIDKVNLSSSRQAYSITKNANSLQASGPDGADQFFEVERLSFSGSNLAFDLSASEHAGQAMEFIGVIAPGHLNTLPVRGAIISLFDQGQTMEGLCQLALELNLIPRATNAQLANAVFSNVTGGGTASQEMTNTLVSYIESHSQANFLAAVAGLHINVDLVGLQQTGVEYTI